MKKWLSFLIVWLVFQNAGAQDILITKRGQISFFSKTPMENIEAQNNEVSSVLNKQNGEIVFAVLIKGFHFERALMEEHFNENYMESDKFPKSTFKGRINNITSVDIAKDGSYAVTADGDLMIHNITKKINLPGTIVVKAGQLELHCKFKVVLKDYNIQIPSLVADKIDETINVSVDCKYEAKK
jgi:YceI-like domain